MIPTLLLLINHLSSTHSLAVDDALDVHNDLSYFNAPFGGAVETIYTIPTIRQILNFPTENDARSNFNPGFGKLGIAMAAIYGIRNARLSIQHFQGPESLLTDLITLNPPQSQEQMIKQLTRLEGELFTSFYHWNERSNDPNKWQNFVSQIYRIYGNQLTPYRPFFIKQSDLNNIEINGDNNNNGYMSKVPIVGSNSVNYGITATKLFDEDKNGQVKNSFFKLDKGDVDITNINNGNDGNVIIPDITLNNGVSVPLIGFGSWPLTGDACYQALMLAVKNGYRLIDTSQNYNNEEVIARVIEDSINNGIIKDRSEIIIADKLSYNQDFGNETQQTLNAFNGQLEKLKTDYIDIYMIHGPIGDRNRLKQAWYTMEELYFQGKIKVLAVSNYNMWELRELLRYARVIPAMLQTKFDVFTQGSQAPWVANVRPLAQKYNIYIQGYCIQNSWPGQLPAINDFHVKYITKTNYPGKTETQVLLRWAYQYGIQILVRSSNNERQIENINIFNDGFKISDIDMQRLNGLITMYSPFRVNWMNDIYLLEKRDN